MENEEIKLNILIVKYLLTFNIVSAAWNKNDTIIKLLQNMPDSIKEPVLDPLQVLINYKRWPHSMESIKLRVLGMF